MDNPERVDVRHQTRSDDKQNEKHNTEIYKDEQHRHHQNSGVNESEEI